MSITITSTAFTPGAVIPAAYTCDGKDSSPALAWTGIPSNTKSLVLIADDPDAPGGTWVHWVCYDLAPGTTGLSENIPKADTLPGGGKQGLSDFRAVGYGGPCPPSGTHRYFFRLYALDTMLNLPARKTRQQIEAAMKGHVVGSGELMGTYRRKPQAG